MGCTNKTFIYHFNNGSLLINNFSIYDYSYKLPKKFFINNKEVFRLKSEERENSLCFIKNVFLTENDLFESETSKKIDMEYSLINEKENENLQKSISKETYDSLSNFFQKKYESGKQQTNKTRKKLELIFLNKVENDYIKNHEFNNIFEEIVFEESCSFNRVFSFLPKDIQKFVPLKLSSNGVFRSLGRILLHQEKEEIDVSKYGSFYIYNHSYSSYSQYANFNNFSITRYATEYNGETKKVEMRKNNGRFYATPRYRTVKDLPKEKKIEIKKDTLPEIVGKDFNELFQNFEIIAEKILLNYKKEQGDKKNEK